MEFPFYEPLSEIIIEGKTYTLNLSVGLVLQYFELRKNPEGMSDTDIDEIALKWFIPSLSYKMLGAERASELIGKIEREYIDTGKRRIAGKKASKRVVNFSYDSGYIYAAFMQVYGIDLYEQAYKLHWRKFIFMFENLPEDTAISQIMRIRAKDIDPKAKPEEIQRLSELKVIYALPDENEDQEKSGQVNLNGLFNYLYAKAKAGENIG